MKQVAEKGRAFLAEIVRTSASLTSKAAIGMYPFWVASGANDHGASVAATIGLGTAMASAYTGATGHTKAAIAFVLASTIAGGVALHEADHTLSDIWDNAVEATESATGWDLSAANTPQNDGFDVITQNEQGDYILTPQA